MLSIVFGHGISWTPDDTLIFVSNTILTKNSRLLHTELALNQILNGSLLNISNFIILIFHC